MSIFIDFLVGVLLISVIILLGYSVMIFFSLKEEEKLSHRIYKTFSVIVYTISEKILALFEPCDIKRKRKDSEEYNWALLSMDSGEMTPNEYYTKYQSLQKAMERLSISKQKWIDDATPFWCNGVICHECYKYYIYKNKDLRISFTELFEQSPKLRDALRVKGISKEEWINDGENIKSLAHEYNKKWIDEHRGTFGKWQDHVNI